MDYTPSVATPWALLLGTKSQDGSAAALAVAAALRARGVAVAGFVQEPVLEDGERAGHRLRRLATDEIVAVGRRGTEARAPSEESFCSFVFDGDAFAAARRWLELDAAGARVLVLHEASKLEIAHKGHHDAIRAALDGGRLVVLAVRADQLFGVMERFGLDEPVASLESADPEAVEAFAAEVAEAVSATAR